MEKKTIISLSRRLAINDHAPEGGNLVRWSVWKREIIRIFKKFNIFLKNYIFIYILNRFDALILKIN